MKKRMMLIDSYHFDSMKCFIRILFPEITKEEFLAIRTIWMHEDFLDVQMTKIVSEYFVDLVCTENIVIKVDKKMFSFLKYLNNFICRLESQNMQNHLHGREYFDKKLYSLNNIIQIKRDLTRIENYVISKIKASNIFALSLYAINMSYYRKILDDIVANREFFKKLITGYTMKL